MLLGNIYTAKESGTAKEFGVYQTISRLAAKGYNRIHLAQSTQPPWQMAVIKIHMKRRLRLQPQNEREAFLQGTQSLCQLKHPHLLSLIDAGFRDGWPYVIMEHASGGSLRQRLDQQILALPPTEEVLTLIEQVSQALYYLHQQHIVHGNIKPENILFIEHDQALLSDLDPMTFSEAPSSTDLTLYYTSPYTAPEQIAGQRRSSQSDQYALGCIAYELFTGRPPCPLSDPSLQHKRSAETVVPPTQINPSLSEQIEQVILKAMAKDANDRYENVLQFNQALHVAVGLSTASLSTATRNTETQIQEEGPAPSSTFFEDATLPVETSGHHEEHEEGHIALYSKLPAAVTQSQTSQKRVARIKTAVQIWLIVACLGIALGATSEIFHLFSWLDNPSQQSGPTTHVVRGIVSSTQTTSSSPATHPSPTAMPTPTPSPTPLPTPTIAPTPTRPPLPTGNPTVADAGYETPSLGHVNDQYDPTGSSWTFSNGSGIAANGSAFTSKNPNAPQGTQVAFLQGTGLMRQTIIFAAGSYHISFDAAQRKGVNKSVQNFQVLIDGYVVGTFTPSGFKYKPYSTNSLTVSAGSHVLTFQGLDSNGGDNTAFVDVVTVQ